MQRFLIKHEYIQSLLRKSLSSWNNGKLSQVSGACVSNTLSMSTAKSERKVSACSTIKSDHQAKAFETWSQRGGERERENRNNANKMSQILYSNMELGSSLTLKGRCSYYGTNGVIVKKQASWMRLREGSILHPIHSDWEVVNSVNLPKVCTM